MNIITIFLLLLNMSISPDERLTLLVETLLTQNEISFEINQYDIYKKNHNPKWRGNYEGGGIYIFENYMIYFNNIVGHYDDIFIDRISKNTLPEKINFINHTQDFNDSSYLIKCLGVGKIINQDNIEDAYYGKNIYQYELNKYKVEFIIDKGKIISINILKK